MPLEHSTREAVSEPELLELAQISANAATANWSGQQVLASGLAASASVRARS